MFSHEQIIRAHKAGPADKCQILLDADARYDFTSCRGTARVRVSSIARTCILLHEKKIRHLYVSFNFDSAVFNR